MSEYVHLSCSMYLVPIMYQAPWVYWIGNRQIRVLVLFLCAEADSEKWNPQATKQYAVRLWPLGTWGSWKASLWKDSGSKNWETEKSREGQWQRTPDRGRQEQTGQTQFTGSRECLENRKKNPWDGLTRKWVNLQSWEPDL